MTLRALPLLLLFLGLAACQPAVEPEPPHDGPRLLLFLVVDQLGSEQLEQYDELLTGGLKTLLESGVTFSQVRHFHANTATAPGHATLVSGLYPSHHGIIANYWQDRESGRRVYSVRDLEGSKSPGRLMGTSLGDWLKNRSSSSRVYSVSGKDRAAILMGGHQADGAFWYDKDRGEVGTTGYYGDQAETLAEGFNRQRLLDRLYGRLWEPMPVSEEELAGVGIRDIDLGPLVPTFPHPLGEPGARPWDSFYSDIQSSPYMDDHMAAFAAYLLGTRELGQGPRTDLLAVSFSALDYVGHRHGPESREYLDVLMRLDRTLEGLLAEVDRLVGLENTLISFSADHGVVRVPEGAREGEHRTRSGVEQIRCFQGVFETLSSLHPDRQVMLPGPFVVPEAIGGETKIDGFLAEVASQVEACPGVERIWTRAQILGPPTEDPMHEMFRNTYHPELSPDLMAQFEEGFLASRRSAANHGTPYDYDARVPLVVWRHGITHRRIDAPVRTVDLAPTLAALLGLERPAELDGVDRSAMIEVQAAAQ